MRDSEGLREVARRPAWGLAVEASSPHDKGQGTKRAPVPSLGGGTAQSVTHKPTARSVSSWLMADFFRRNLGPEPENRHWSYSQTSQPHSVDTG